MSNKIYFSDKPSQKSKFWPLVRAVSWSLYKIAPKWTFDKVADLLLTPQRYSKKQHTLPQDMELFNVSSDDGQLQCYQIGEGPTVLLVHGWSGASHQFFPLMEQLAASGYKALAFDHPAHGGSEGEYASLPQLINAVNSVVDNITAINRDNLKGIIAHSMGCVAVANANPEIIKNIPIGLIAPWFHFKQDMFDTISRFGLQSHFLEDLLESFSIKYKIDLNDVELNNKLSDYSHNTVIIHDREDKFTQYSYSEIFTTEHPETQLYTTEGLGHGRIINSDEAWQTLKKHFNIPEPQAIPA